MWNDGGWMILLYTKYACPSLVLVIDMRPLLILYLAL